MILPQRDFQASPNAVQLQGQRQCAATHQPQYQAPWRQASQQRAGEYGGQRIGMWHAVKGSGQDGTGKVSAVDVSVLLSRDDV
ncbi:hypothetical protein AO262_25415 [Pseudomonas fluorescens ABAC62]|nr:hypothetical protein AO262_25415 [Pseudomonas fluorescens ABAC62]